jgi:hypothetical protein
MGRAAQAEALASAGRGGAGRGGEGRAAAAARVEDGAAGAEEKARAPAGDRHGFSRWSFWFVGIARWGGEHKCTTPKITDSSN